MSVPPPRRPVAPAPALRASQASRPGAPPKPATSLSRSRSGAVQAELRPGSNKVLQRKPGNGVDAFEVNLTPKPGGQPIPEAVRTRMEAVLGHDFSDVRIHVGQDAPRIGALAFTWGTQIHFAPGQYQPHTHEGQKLLAHELTHVVQQRQGRVRNPLSGVAVVQDRALEAEADRAGQLLQRKVAHAKPPAARR